MKIKIADRSKEKIGEALTRALGAAKAHTHSVSEVFSEAAFAEETLEELAIPKTMRSGTVALDQGGGPGKAYARKSYFVTASKITLTRGSKDWFLTDVKRVEVSADAASKYTIHIDQEAFNHGLFKRNIILRQAA